jgi:hypothetical protein
MRPHHAQQRGLDWVRLNLAVICPVFRSRGDTMARKTRKSSARKKSGGAKKRGATRGRAGKRATARRGAASKSRSSSKKRQAKSRPAKRSSRQSPVARVRRVTREVVQQAQVAVAAGVETLRDLGGNLVDRMRTDNSGETT